MKHLFLSLLLSFSIASYGQTLVNIDGIQYAFKGTSAAVVSGRSYDDVYISSYKYMYYSNSSYTIPSQITYNGTTFTVDKIGTGAFDDGHSPHTDSKNIKSIKLPETITTIGSHAFGGTNISSMIFPKSLKSFASNLSAFKDNDFLATLIYTSRTAPAYWTATSKTYVPDKSAYNNPSFRINGCSIIEMISFTENSFEYTGESPTTTWTNNVEGYTASLSMPVLSVETGEHEEWIPVTFTKDSESFTADVVYRYTIKPAKVTAKVSNSSREYGDENPQFTVSYSGFINGENESVITTLPNVSTTATKKSNAGDYPITLSGGIATNYQFVYEPGVLTVTKAPLSAKVGDATKVYGSRNPAFTIEYYGLKNDETAPAWTTRPTFQTEATENSRVGEYEVTATNGVPVNYDLANITAGTLTVTPAPLTIKANDATRQYYSDEPNFGYICNGFVNGENEEVLSPKPLLSTSAKKSSNIGTFPIKISGASNPNYSISYVDGTLTITPKTLTVSVGNYDRVYNEDNPEFEVEYSGFVENEDEKVLITKASASTTATKTSDVGFYPINVTGGSAENYKFSYRTGTLSITKAEQTIVWDQNLSGLNVGDQVELKAEASSGLPITYTMENDDVAEIYSTGTKQYLDCRTGGLFSIRAIQNGNKNYYSSPRASNTVVIVGSNPPTDPVLTIKQGDEGSIKTQVSKGSVYTFTIAPDNGWIIHSVSFNDSDVTGQLNSDNAFTTPAINGNATLFVVYEKGNESAVNAAKQSAVKIQGMSFGVRVSEAAPSDVIQVYSTNGALLKSMKAEGQFTDIPLPKDNVYIIKVGEKTVKLGH